MLDSPIISNAVVNAGLEHVVALTEFLTFCTVSNPLISKFLTVWEMMDFLCQYPILPSNVTDKLLEAERSRAPISADHSNEAISDTFVLEHPHRVAQQQGLELR